VVHGNAYHLDPSGAPLPWSPIKISGPPDLDASFRGKIRQVLTTRNDGYMIFTIDRSQEGWYMDAH